jgi:DNA-binding NarL/FixJ family response regulator
MLLGTKIRVVLVDDHQMVREALRDYLLKTEDIDVAGEAADASSGMTLVASEKPDVAVIDLALPGLDGISLMQELKRHSPRTRALILTGHVRSDSAPRAFAAGAHGFALKGQRGDQLLAAIRSVARGERYVAPELDVSPPASDSPDPIASLSRRERQIFDLIVQGFSNERIAEQLSISHKTVETHRAHINEKLGVHSPMELMRFAVTRGLLRGDAV